MNHGGTEPQRGHREEISESLNRVSGQIIDAAFAVHSALGPGLLEHVYEACIEHELTKRGLRVARQLELPVIYDGLRLEVGFRIDLLVEGSVIVELKAVEFVLPVHTAQMLTYLRLSGHRMGLLINFNVPAIKQGIHRLVL